MKRKGTIILRVIAGGVIIGVVLLVSFISVKDLLEKPFPIRNAGLSDESYAMALEKIDTFAEELEGMDLDSIKIYVWDDFRYYPYEGSYEILVDYRAPAEKIKNYIIKSVAEIKEKEVRKVQEARAEKIAAKKSREILKELRKKGLDVEAEIASYKQGQLMGLENLKKALSDQEIKDLKTVGMKIYVTHYFSADLRSKKIWIRYKATPEKIKNYIKLRISDFKTYEREKKEAREKEKELKKKREGVREKIKRLKESISKKLGG